MSGNTVNKISNYNVTVPNPNKIHFVGGDYSTVNGTLSIVFSENINAVNSSQITMQSGSINHTFSGSYVAQSGLSADFASAESTQAAISSIPSITSNHLNIDGNVATITLGADVRDKFAQASDITIIIDEDAVGSNSNRTLDTTQSQIFVSDTIKPTLATAAYHKTSGILTLTFSETVGTISSAGLTLKSGSETVIPSYIPTKSGSTITVQLSGAEKGILADSTRITLDIKTKAVTDVSNNPIDAIFDISRNYTGRYRSNYNPH